MFEPLIQELRQLSDNIRELPTSRYLRVQGLDEWKILQQEHLRTEIFPLPLSPRTLRAGPRVPPQPSYALRTGVLVDSLTGGYQPLPNGARFGGVNSPVYAAAVEDRIRARFDRSLVPPVEEFADRLVRRMSERLPE